jgi:flagella basal body P-ring formation protein FlgA
MRRVHSLLALFILGTAGAGAIPCIAPTGDWITGADVAVALPALAGLDPTLKVGYAPVAGLERVFHPDEVRRLALAHGLPDPRVTTNVCFAWPVEPLALETMRGAMEKSLAGRSPQIEILTRSALAAPAGEVVFPVSGLTAYSANPVIWKGYVFYAGTRRFDIWANVRVRVTETHLKAQGAIRVGQRLSLGQWRTEQYTGPLLRESIFSDAAQVSGMVARRDFADNSLLVAGLLEAPKAVEVGDVVIVLAENGAAHIEAPGVALNAGVCGEVIAVRNPRSNRLFKARVAAAGRVEALPGTSAGLVAMDTAKENPQ